MRLNKRAIAPGTQPERLADAGPVRTSAWPRGLTGLLALLLLILILFFASSAASFAQTATPDTSAKPSEKTEVSRLTSDTLADLARRARSGSEFERDGVCYTMRTYVMAREDKHSDSTRIVRATRCLPEWKIEFKSAVAPVLNKDDAPEKR